MPNEENYIGVAMGLDVTDLKSGLKEANKQITMANSEFKAASSGMDDWTKSTEGLTAKVNQLDTVLTAQKSKLSGLQAEYQKVASEQGENSAAAEKLKVQINNQQAVVNTTQKEFNNYSDTLKQAKDGTINLEEVSIKGGKAVKTVGDAAEESGGKLDGLKAAAGVAVGAIAAIGAAIGGAVTGFLSLAESTRETRTTMAKLEASFTTAGHSADDAAETYTNLYGVVGDTGKAREAAAFLGQMAKDEEELAEMTNILTGVYAQYGDALPIEGLAEAMNHTAQLGSVQGNLADALEWQGVNVDDFNTKLAGLSTEEERQQLIVDTLNGLYSEQSAAYKELNKDVIAAQKAEEEMNLALADLGAIAEPIMTTLKVMATDLLKAITPFVELIGEGLTGALNGTAGASQKLADGIGGILDMLVNRAMEIVPRILEIVLDLFPQLISTILSAIPSLVDTVAQLATDIISMIAQLLPTVVEQIVAIIPMIITSLVNAIPELLKAATELLMAIVEAIPTIVASLVTALPEIIDTIIDALISSIGILTEAAVQLLMAIVEAIPTIITALTEALPKIITSIIDGLLEALPVILDAAITLLMAIVEAIPQIITALADALPDIITSITEALIDAIPMILETAIQLLMSIVEAIPKFIPELVKVLPDIITAIVKLMIESKLLMFQAAIKLFMAIVEALPDIIKELGKDFPDVIKSVLDMIVDSASQLLESVKFVWDAVKNWFSKTWSSATTSLSKGSSELWNNIKKWFSDGWKNVVDFFTKSIPEFFKKLKEWFDKLPYNLGLLIGKMIASVAKFGVDLYTFATTEIPKFVDKVIEFIKTLPTKVAEWLTATFNKVTSWGSDMVSKAKTVATDFVNSAINVIKGLPDKIWSFLTTAASNVVKWGSNLATNAKNAAKNMFDAVVNGIKGLPDQVRDIGSNIVKGLWNGINDMVSWIGNKISSFGSGVLDGLKSFFQIASPSKLIENEVGVNVGKAVVPSRPAALSKVKKSLQNFKDYVSDNLGDIKTGLTVDSLAEGANGVSLTGARGSTVVNAGMTVNYNGSLSRKQLKQLENDNYTSIKTRLQTEGVI